MKTISQAIAYQWCGPAAQYLRCEMEKVRNSPPVLQEEVKDVRNPVADAQFAGFLQLLDSWNQESLHIGRAGSDDNYDLPERLASKMYATLTGLFREVFPTVPVINRHEMVVYLKTKFYDVVAALSMKSLTEGKKKEVLLIMERLCIFAHKALLAFEELELKRESAVA